MDDLLDLAICAFLSILGGLGRMLGTKSKKPIKLSDMGRNAVVSLSIGVGVFFFVYAFLSEARENSYVVFAVGWATGFLGPWVVTGFIEKYLENKGIKKEEK